MAAQTILALQPPLAWVAATGALFGMSGGFTILLLAQPRYVFPIDMTGQATTAVNLFAIGGAALVQWWMGLIISLFPAAGVSYPPQAYTAALLASASGTALALFFYLPMRRRTS